MNQKKLNGMEIDGDVVGPDERMAKSKGKRKIHNFSQNTIEVLVTEVGSNQRTLFGTLSKIKDVSWERLAVSVLWSPRFIRGKNKSGLTRQAAKKKKRLPISVILAGINAIIYCLCHLVQAPVFSGPSRTLLEGIYVLLSKKKQGYKCLTINQIFYSSWWCFASSLRPMLRQSSPVTPWPPLSTNNRACSGEAHMTIMNIHTQLKCESQSPRAMHIKSNDGRKLKPFKWDFVVGLGSWWWDGVLQGEAVQYTTCRYNTANLEWKVAVSK